MAKRVEGVTERLLECAKEEFLKNGYENASLRVIAEKAGSSKGAIYIRYPDKESLYRALTQPVADGFCGLLKELLGGFESMSPENQREQINTYGNNGFCIFMITLKKFKYCLRVVKVKLHRSLSTI